MNILLHSRFYPHVGGIETVSWLLAHEWQRMGEQVTVVSDVACTPTQLREFPFPVHYRPNFRTWLKLMRQADVLVHMNIRLKALWPLLLVPRPFVAVHHGFYIVDRKGRQDWRERIKLRVMAGACNIAVSQAVAGRLPVRNAVIPNPVDIALFRPSAETPRLKELVFVGRLVSDKGCDQLIQALGVLSQNGLRPQLTIIGDGPERPALEQQVAALNLTAQVNFTGALSQSRVAQQLQIHQILIIPSLWEEPFGLVAVEGAAGGCVVLGSDGGGLPEAIGPTGLTFRRGDITDFVSKLTWLLEHRQTWPQYRNAAANYLARHQPRWVAAQYLALMEKQMAKH